MAFTKCNFKCPSCETKFAAIEVGDSATLVIRRTCRRCKERWQLVVNRIGTAKVGTLKDGNPAEAILTKAEFTFLGK